MIQLPTFTPERLISSLTEWARNVTKGHNSLSRGEIVAAYSATAAPTTGPHNRGDIVRNSAPSELGATGSKYVITGWICTVEGTPGTWVELRIPAESWAGASLRVDEEGTSVEAATTRLNFVGAGVTAARVSAGYVTVTIPASGAVLSPGCASNYAIGSGALGDVSLTGCWNIAVGGSALANHEIGDENVAIGYTALFTSTGGYENTAIGTKSAYSLTTGIENVAVGYASLYDITVGFQNTAIGRSSAENVTTGDENTACGAYSLFGTNTANQNTACGAYSLYGVTSGGGNVAVGYITGNGITTGTGNTILGAGIQSLSAGLQNNIILASGNAARATFDGTTWTLTGDKVNIVTAKTPASATATGVAGDICWDTSYIYVCTATNTWKRVAIATW